MIRKILLMMGLGLVTASGWAGFTASSEYKGGADTTLTLLNKTVHFVSTNASLVTGNGLVADSGSHRDSASAMNMASGVTSVIWIPAGVKLRLSGGTGMWYMSGAPAIHLPEFSTLFIAGGPGSSLEVTGGHGGNGGRGDWCQEAGGTNARGLSDNPEVTVDHWKEGDSLCAGRGGTGGYGGGAGAVAIGGRSGNGGGNMAGPELSAKEIKKGLDTGFEGSYDREYHNWGDAGGIQGCRGGAGEKMGTLYVLGGVKITATAGAAGSSHGAGGGVLNEFYGRIVNINGGTDYFVGGGGAGGGGGRGPAPSYCIGGGCGGAGGGGCGASGTTVCTHWYNEEDYGYANFPTAAWSICGGPGQGGQGERGECAGAGSECKDIAVVNTYWKGTTIRRSDKDEVGPGGTRSQLNLKKAVETDRRWRVGQFQPLCVLPAA